MDFRFLINDFFLVFLLFISLFLTFYRALTISTITKK